MRRQVQELKLEKDALNLELTSIRSRLAKLETDKARVDLELSQAESEVDKLTDRYDDTLKHSETRQRQAIDLLETKMVELRGARDEMSQTVKNMLGET